MTDLAPVLLAALDDVLLAGRNGLFAAARPFVAAPVLGVPFPLREVGVLFAGKTLPCWGLFRDVPAARFAECAPQVSVLAHEGADRFTLELALAQPDARLVIARTPRLATLGASVAPVVALAQKGPSAWSRLRGKTRFTENDVLKVPPLALAVDGVELRLVGGGEVVPAGPRATGRGEMYERYFVCDGPFVVLLLGKTSGEVQVAVWVEDAAALAP